MGLIIENISGAELDINDLGFGMAAGTSIDLTLEADALAVAQSGNGGDLQTLIIAADIVVKDPSDNSTNLVGQNALDAVRTHNDTHYRMPAGARIADAIDVDLTGIGVDGFLAFNTGNGTFEPKTPTDVAGLIESSIDIANIQGGHNAWEITDVDGDTRITVDSGATDDLDIIQMLVENQVKLQIFSTQINATQRLDLAAGTASLPALTFDAEQQTGLYRALPNVLGFSTNGVERMALSDTDLTMGADMEITLGTNGAFVGDPTATAAAPTFTFEGDGNTGMYQVSNNTLGMSAGGVTAAEFGFNGNSFYGEQTLPAYPNTRDDGDTTKALYVDAAGNVRYGDITLPTVSSDQVAIQVGRNNSLAIGTTFADIAWEVVDFENDPGVLERDDTNTDRILIKESGLHLVAFNLSIDATTGEQTYNVRIRANDTTVIPGSLRVISEDDEINDVSNLFICDCVAGDYLTMQVNSTGTGSVLTPSSTMTVIKLRATKGEPGPPGSGSTITVQEEGTGLANGPHATLNFIGGNVTATDAGGGVANITVAALAEDMAALTRRATTSQTLPAGTTTELVYDTTDVANNTSVINTNANPAKIVAQETGMYLYIAEGEFSIGDDTTATIELNAAIGGVAIGGQWVRRVQFFEDGSVPGFNRGRDYHAHPIFLNAGDEISTLATPTLDFGTGAVATNGSVVHTLIRLSGTAGAPGAPGTPGSGSTINIEDEGTLVTSSPFSVIDFVGSGVTVTDGGSGTATVTVDAAASPLIAYYHNGGTTQSFTTTYTTINFNTTVRQDAGYSEAAGVVTFANAGTYEVEYNVSLTALSNSRTGARTRATINNVEVPGTLAFGYHRQTNPGRDTLTARFLVTVTAGQQLRIQAQRYNGSATLSTVANACRLNIRSVV